MEHAIETTFEQVTLLQHRACMAFDTRVSLQVGGRRKQVGDDQFRDYLPIEVTPFQNFACQTCAQKSCTASDQNPHECFLVSVVVFGHGRAALADEKVHVSAFIGLQNVVDVEFPVA